MYIESTFYALDDAIKFKNEHQNLIGKWSKSEETTLLKIVVLQMTPTEFGELWAKQRFPFEQEDASKILSDEDFEKELVAFDNIELSKKDGCFYEVVGIMRYGNGEPRFQPMSYLLSNGVE